MEYYPVNDFGPLMKGMVIGGMGIFHVFLAQFAIGGGMLMCYFQWLAQSGREPAARVLLTSYFRFLILVSFVLGALTGVGMWFTTIQISPQTIGVMVKEFHWVWATEYTFFALEVVAGYAFYRCAPRLNDRQRMTLLVLYSAAAWFSLFWINGILSWQLTPGRWLESGNVWAGFFNPSFWPSLLFRTIVAMTIAALVACAVINAMSGVERDVRHRLIRRASHFLAPMILMPALGVWFLAVIPEDSRSWAMGGSIAMTLFMGMAIGASVLIGAYAFIGLLYKRLYINGATATLLLALAFGATAGGEFVREGVRKPYTVRQVLYSNAVEPEAVARLRETGVTAGDPYPVRDPDLYPRDDLARGALVFRNLCLVCHTVDGANGLTHLTGSWTPDQMRMNIAKLQHTKAFMPPFAGTAAELEDLARFITWSNAGRPEDWTPRDEAADIERIQMWLDEAGVLPGDFERYREGEEGEVGQ